MIIQKATMNDADDIFKAGTGETSFYVDEVNSFWSLEQIQSWIGVGHDILLVARNNERLMGFILTQIHKPTGKATIENILVVEKFREQGIGAKLLEKCLEQLKIIGATYVCLMTNSKNLKEIEYFQKQGFEKGLNFIWFGKKI